MRKIVLIKLKHIFFSSGIKFEILRVKLDLSTFGLKLKVNN
jgi:hypothetical protein